jgi:hypothetical protein
MKLDKDTFVKHQFWFLLGAYLLVWIIAVFWLKGAATGSESPIEAAKKKYESDTTGLKSASANPVNVSAFVPPWEKQYKTFNGYKSEIWEQAWALQRFMYDWPQAWMEYKDMYTPQTELTDKDRTAFKHDYYPAEIKNLEDNAPGWLKPIEFAGGIKAVLDLKPPEVVPTREECWLLQEDYWVKRQLLAALYSSMLNLAVMYPVKLEDKDKPTDKEIVARYRYRNENWEITLNLRKSDKGIVIGGDSTIKNVHPTGRVQSLTSANGRAIAFNLVQTRNANQVQDKTARFYVEGEPVAWDEVREFSVDKDKKRTDYPVLPGINWDATYLKDHPVGMSQAFDETTSPIRRLNAIKLCQQDCRTYIWPLQPNQELMQLDVSPEDADKKGPGGAAPPNPGMPGAGMAGGGMAGGGMAGGGMAGGGMQQKPPVAGMNGPAPPGAPGGAETVATNTTPNNSIPRDRYLRPPDQDKSVNPPSRHLPFALQLIVEQTHVNDVKLALANSPLRVQITQAEFHHAKNYRPQNDSGKGTDAANASGYFAGPGSYNMNMYGGGMRQQPGGMQRPAGMGGYPSMGMGGSGSKPRTSMPMPGMSGPMMSSAPPMMMQGPPPGVPGTMNPGGRPNPDAPQATGAKKEKSSVANQTDDNLVEVTIYGIAVLYRRPDSLKKTDQPAAPGVPPAKPVGGQPVKPTTPPPAGGDKR